MAGTTPKQKAHGLLSHYSSLYGERYKRQPKINKYRDQWGFIDGVLTDMSVERARELLEFYFRTTSPNDHSLKWFFFHYDTLLESLEAQEEDDIKRRELREATKRRVEEFRARNGK